MPNAIDQAECVAENIMGAAKEYVAQPWFWSDQFDTKLQIAGLNTGYDNVVRREVESGAVSFWYFKGDTLLAVDAMNSPRDYMVGKRMIETGKSPTTGRGGRSGNQHEGLVAPMRIIAGAFRGTALASVGKGDSGAHLRPTTDRVRETLFNVLMGGRYGDPITDAVVLDLFAGTGALGLEALSRGAASVTFADDGRKAISLIRQNVKLTPLVGTDQGDPVQRNPPASQ